MKLSLTLTFLLLISLATFGQAPKIYFNFGKDHPGPSPWNNANSDPLFGLSFNNLLDDGGLNTGVGIQLMTNWGGLFNEGATTGDDSGIVPDEVLTEYYYFGIFGAPDVVQIKVTGLVPGASYNFQFIASSSFRGAGVTDNGSTRYVIGSDTVELYVDGNTTEAATINDIVVDPSGEVVISMSKVGDTPVGYINAMIIELPEGTLYTPSDFSVSPTSGITLTWNDNSNAETGYEIYRTNIVDNEPYTLITTTPADTTSYNDTDVLAGYTYLYKIRAKDSTQTSGFTQELEQRMPVVTGESLTVGRKVYVNFSQTYSGHAPWNNTSKDPTLGSKFLFNDDDGNASGIFAELLTSFGGVYTDGAVTGDDSGIFPDSVLKEYYWFGALGAPDLVRLRIGGLPADIACNLKLFGGSVFRGLGITDNGHTRYIIGLDTISLDVEGNTSNLATFSGLETNNKGEIILQVGKDVDATTGYINALILELSDEVLYGPAVFNGDYITGSGVSLKWNDANSSETGYEIYRKNITTSGSYSLLITTSANDTTYLDTTVDANKVYAYRIRAISASIQSAYSNEIQIKTIPVKKIYINFSQTYNVSGYWNNTARNPVSAFDVTNMKDEHGAYTGIDMSLGVWGGVNNAGAITGNDSGIVPDSVLQEYYWFGIFGAPEQEKITLHGFLPDQIYNFKFIGSSVFRISGITDNGSTIYSIGSHADTLYVEGNTVNVAEVDEISPDSQGEIQVTLSKYSGSPAGYINAMIIELPESMLYAPGNLFGIYVQGSGNQLSWVDNSTTETGFEIQRRNITTNGSYSVVDTTAANATTWLDTSITEGTVYSYRIKAISSTTASAWATTKDVRSVPVKKVYVNFGGTEVASSPWNNALGNPVAGTTFNDLTDEAGNDSGISILLQTAWGGFFNQGAVTGDDSGVIPDAALKEYFYFGIFGAPDREIVKIRGLDPSKDYNFKFLGSSVFTGGGDNGSTRYRIGADSIALNVQNNSSSFAEFYDIIPDTNGEVEVDMSKAPGAPAGYLNAMIIEIRSDQLYAPASFTGDYVDGTGVVLNWVDNNTDETSYQIYRTLATEDNYQLLETTSTNAETYTDTGTSAGNSYKYRMIAVRSSDQSINSQIVTVASIPTKKVFFNFGKNYAAASPWNNAGKDPSEGLLFTDLVNEDTNPTSVRIELLTAFGGVFDQGATTGNDSGIVPDNALQEYYYFGVLGAPEEVQIKISGLSIGYSYNLSLVASSVFHQLSITDNGHTTFTINGITKSVYVEGNTSSAAVFKGVLADNQGSIVITIAKAPDATVGYINALVLEGPDIPAEYYALSDGNWDDPLWSHFKTATAGVVLPPDSEVRIEGKKITTANDVSVQKLVLSAAGGNPGVLTLNGGMLVNEGELTISDNHAENRIDVLGASQLKIRPKAKRIMPIGNSITQASSTTYSYRYALWKKLIDEEIPVNFVGSQSTNNGGNPIFPPYNGQQFDTDNEGHWGKRADEILAGMPAWAATAKPDIVLLHAGSNDMLQFQTVASTKEDLRGIIQAVRVANPNVVILLATLIPNTSVDMSAMATAITALASEEDTTESPVVLVDQYTDFNATTDTYDGLHPNAGGEEKMAQKWFDAIVALSTP